MPTDIIQAILSAGDKSIVVPLLLFFIWRNWKDMDVLKELVERNTEAHKEHAIAITKLAERLISDNRRGEHD